MAEETAVLRRQHRLDEAIGQLVDRHGILVDDAAVADLVAVAVEEGDGEIALGAPVALGLLEGGKSEREQEDEAGGAEVHRLAGHLEDRLLPALGMEAAGEDGDLLPDLARAETGVPHRRIDPGIDAQEDVPPSAARFRLLLVVVFHDRGLLLLVPRAVTLTACRLTSCHHRFILVRYQAFDGSRTDFAGKGYRRPLLTFAPEGFRGRA